MISLSELAWKVTQELISLFTVLGAKLSLRLHVFNLKTTVKETGLRDSVQNLSCRLFGVLERAEGLLS